jgi:lipid II:glycine glycyltransferase (peptidoglycan interpeptide bridge formation enzyme)
LIGVLEVVELKDINIFKEIYLDTMDRINADKFYLFNDEYFKLMSEDERYIILGVEYERRIAACGIFISSGEYFHYHLAGSLKEYQKFSPNNLMLYEAIKLGKKLGNKLMFLGGGLQNSTEDSLFKFKASFSKNMCDFYIGKRVHNKIIYDYLISQWEKKNGRKSSILLQYRYK